MKYGVFWLALFFGCSCVALSSQKTALDYKKSAIGHFEYFLQHDKTSPQRPSVLLTLADLYFDLDLSKSIVYLEQFIQQYPQNTHIDAAYYLLGIAYLYEENLGQAKNYFEYFVANFKNSQNFEEVLFRLGLIYFEQHNYLKSATYLGPILQNTQSKFYSKALYQYAWIAYLKNNYPKAIQEFSKLLELDSGNNPILYKEALRYIAKSLFEESKDPLEQINSQTWAVPVLIQLGNLFTKADQNHSAVAALQKALLLDPQNQEARQTLKPILLDLAIQTHKDKKFRQAAEHYAAFIKNFPEAADLDQITFYEGEAYFDAKEYLKAAQAFKQVRDWPTTTEYRERAALNLVYADTEQIKQEFPDYDLSSIELSKQGYLKGPPPPIMLDFIEAADVLQKPSFLFQAAGIYWAYGQTEQALARLRNPAVKSLAAGILLGYSFEQANLLFSQKKYEKAAQLYLEILHQNPEQQTEKIIFNLALSLDRSEHFEKAAHWYSILEKDYPKSPLALKATEWLAIYFEQNNEFKKAASYYLKLPKSPKTLLKAALNFQAAGDFVAQKRVLNEFAKRYHGQDAQADYLNLEDAYEAYQSLKINSSSSKQQARQLTDKTKQLAKLQQSYERIIKNYELSVWTLASIYHIGSLFENLYQALLKAPCPKDISKIDEAACDEYASLLEDKVFILEKKAIDAYKLILEKSPQILDSDAWRDKAQAALYRIKPTDYAPAEIWFTGHLKDPNFYLGNYYFAAGEPDKARESYQRALKQSPTDFDVYFNLGLLELSQKNYAKAKQDLETYLQNGKPTLDLQTRIQTYLKSINQKLLLEKQRHET